MTRRPKRGSIARPSQEDRILEFLLNHGPLTTKEGRQRFGADRMASRINRLKKRLANDGIYKIETTMVKRKTDCRGRPVPVAQYSIRPVFQRKVK